MSGWMNLDVLLEVGQLSQYLERVRAADRASARLVQEFGEARTVPPAKRSPAPRTAQPSVRVRANLLTPRSRKVA